jgi:hypothetical protein
MNQQPALIDSAIINIYNYADDNEEDEEITIHQPSTPEAGSAASSPSSGACRPARASREARPTPYSTKPKPEAEAPAPAPAAPAPVPISDLDKLLLTLPNYKLDNDDSIKVIARRLVLPGMSYECARECLLARLEEEYLIRAKLDRLPKTNRQPTLGERQHLLRQLAQSSPSAQQARIQLFLTCLMGS